MPQRARCAVSCFNMSEKKDEKSSENSKSDGDDHYDPRLDLCSDKFDPILALNSPKVVLPYKDVKPCDNLEIFRSILNKKDAKSRNKDKKKEDEAGPSQIVRRWLPEQMPITKERKIRRNVLTRMEDMKGPLAALTKAMKKGLRLKVVTRNERGVNGQCLGYLTAFDKHWNLALERVTHLWTRKKKRKIAALDSVAPAKRYWKKIPIPEVNIFEHETDKKLETCTRLVKQLMIRGEHIVLINIMKGNGESDSD